MNITAATSDPILPTDGLAGCFIDGEWRPAAGGPAGGPGASQSEDVAAPPAMANARKASDMARTSELEMGWDERPYDLVDWEAEDRIEWEDRRRLTQKR